MGAKWSVPGAAIGGIASGFNSDSDTSVPLGILEGALVGGVAGAGAGLMNHHLTSLLNMIKKTTIRRVEDGLMEELLNKFQGEAMTGPYSTTYWYSRPVIENAVDKIVKPTKIVGTAIGGGLSGLVGYSALNALKENTD
jgi:hypothetical protein